MALLRPWVTEKIMVYLACREEKFQTYISLPDLIFITCEI